MQLNSSNSVNRNNLCIEVLNIHLVYLIHLVHFNFSTLSLVNKDVFVNDCGTVAVHLYWFVHTINTGRHHVHKILENPAISHPRSCLTDVLSVQHLACQIPMPSILVCLNHWSPWGICFILNLTLKQNRKQN